MSEIQVGQINSTDGSTAITVSTGNTTLSGSLAMGANNISFSNGNGIDFSASEGSGADSSVLDDYEEGTWTPTVTGRTFTNARGHYTKVGNLVFIHFECNTISSAISNPNIDGLPFTAASPTGSSSEYSSYMSVDEVASWTLSSGYTSVYLRVPNGATYLQALQSTGENHAAGTNWGTNGTLRAAGFYYTNA